MNTRKARTKRPKLSNDDFVPDFEDASASSPVDPDELDAIRKSRIRDSNKEFARRMTILQAWSQFWSENQTREGDAYPLQEAKNIMKRSKKITCPIQSCRKAFTTIGGLRYHYARCNIERTIKCLVCNPNAQLATRGELLRHMILNHSSELPSLNPEQQEIVSSYFSCEHRIDKREKREKRVNIETESHCNSQAIVKSYYDMIVRNYHLSWSNQRPFMSWFSQPKDYELITHIGERQKHYPPEFESVNVKLPQNGGWTNLKTGEFKEIEFDKRKNPTSYLFYTGGINTAIAWKPKSIYDRESHNSGELLAIAVNCCSMEQSYTFKESLHNEGCIQFWTLENADLKNSSDINSQQVSPTKISLIYMIGHKYGTIFDMAWCPLGTSWFAKETHTDVPFTREGLLALACGDGQIRILCIPDSKFLLSKAQARSSENIIDSTPMFRVKPIANLIPPGTGPSSDYQAMSCKSLAWSAENGQKLIAAGYVNGSVALYDLSTNSSILYVQLDHYRHVYQPQKSWFAHGGPVTSIAFSAFNEDRYLIATGSIDRQVKICNPFDLSATLVSERAPVNKVCWDFRFRGVVAATDHAFTSFNNKVSYKYPYSDGYQSVTIASHRASVYGLANSILTSSVATSDQAGEVFVTPQLINKTYHKRDKNLLSVHSLYTMIPCSLKRQQVIVKSEANNITINQQSSSEPNNQSLVCVDHGTYAVLTSATSNTITSRGNEPNNMSSLVEIQPLVPSIHDLQQQQHHRAIDQSKDQTSIIISTENNEALITSSQGDEADEDGLDAEADFTRVERTVANMPDKFLLPIEHKPVSTYENFKCNYGLEFHTYDSIPTRQDVKIPESCIRAMDMKKIYCDRPCDYPFCSINQVAWSPNTSTYPYLLSATQVGFCRLDKVQIVEQIFKSHVEQMKPKIGDL